MATGDFDDDLLYLDYLDYQPYVNQTYTAADSVVVSNTDGYVLGGAVRIVPCRDMSRDELVMIAERAMGRYKAPEAPPKLRAME